MKEYRKEDLFSIKEAAKICNLSRNAMYMRYFRGQIKAVPTMSHAIYFTRDAIDEFRANYVPFSE